MNGPTCVLEDFTKCQKRVLYDFTTKRQSLLSEDELKHDLEQATILEAAGDNYREKSDKDGECKNVFSTNYSICYDQALRYLSFYSDAERESRSLDDLSLYYSKILLLKNKIIKNKPNSFSKGNTIFVSIELLNKVMVYAKGIPAAECEEFIEKDKAYFLPFFHSMRQLLEPEPSIWDAVKDINKERSKKLKELVTKFKEKFNIDCIPLRVKTILDKFTDWWSDNILSLEWPIFAIDKIYRDHTYHSLRTFYLGNSLLNLYMPNSDEWLNDYLARNSSSSFTACEIRWGWLVSSLLHDIGNIICKSHSSRHDSLNEKFKEYQLSFEWKDVCGKKKVQLKISPEVKDILKKSLDFYPSIENMQEIIEFNGAHDELILNPDFHSLASAILALSVLSANEPHDSLRDNIFLEIIGAIAFHDLNTDHVSENSIKLSEHPLGFLLKLADEAQEWANLIAVSLKEKSPFMSWTTRFTGTCLV